ncbi:MAG: hypothetical protein R3348_08550 [Xanthomonadales bacterium]|nr:hypothetical protein [Xanthomonadales bacterium]
MLDTPVLLVTWRRPDTTRQVLDRVASARPSTLIVASDGPAASSDVSAIHATRALFENLPWDCRVIRLYSDSNMGLALRVCSAIDAAFEEFDRLIVLEDDIVADASFFRYCQEMLDVYQGHHRVMAIRGTGHRLVTQHAGDESYAFTRFMVPWGWATWKRAWSGFDHSFFASDKARWLHEHPTVNRVRESWKQVPWWPGLRGDSNLKQRLASCGDRYAFWLEMCDRQLRLRSWAGLFAMHIIARDGLVATPTVNMIDNIGFRDDAVNTHEQIRMPRTGTDGAMPFPLIHPRGVELNHELQWRMAVDTDEHWTDGARWFFRRFKPRKGSGKVMGSESGARVG